MIEQLRITLPNKPGTLKAMVQALADADVNMKALEVAPPAAGTEEGEANLIVDDLKKATTALEAGGHTYRVEEALAVEMDDRVGGLATILAVLADASINIIQLYAFVTRVEGKSLAVLSVDDRAKASELLEAKGFHMMSRKRIEEKPNALEESGLDEHFGGDFIW